MTIAEELDLLHWMRQRLEEEKARIERDHHITFRELEAAIKDSARVVIDVGGVIQGEHLEVFYSPGRSIVNTSAVNDLIKRDPSLGPVLKKQTDPSPSIRKRDKGRPSVNGDRQTETQAA